MAENTAFSASGEEVISRKIDVEVDVLPQDLSPEAFEDYFEIERTAQEVLKHDYKRVGAAWNSLIAMANLSLCRLLFSFLTSFCMSPYPFSAR